MRRSLFISLATYFTIVACNGLTTPPTGPGTSYPCGVWGVECSHEGDKAICCPQAHICGYDGPWSRCPAGACCYEGDNWPYNMTADKPDSGKAEGVKKLHPASGTEMLPQYHYRTNGNQGVGQ